MIYANKNQIVIPEDERVIGFFGDNLTSTCVFDLSDEDTDSCTVSLYIEFPNGTMDAIELEPQQDGTFVWNVQAQQVLMSGVVFMQVRAEYDGGEVWHSPKGAAEFLSSVEEESTLGEYVPTALEEISEKADAEIARVEEYVQAALESISNYETVYEYVQTYVSQYIAENESDFVTLEQVKELVAQAINELVLPLNLRLDDEEE